MKRPWFGVGPVTSRYPTHAATPSAALRGRPALNPARCTGDAACVQACPTQAIALEPWRVDLGKCLFCGACAAACPEQAITMTTDVELATRQRADLVVDGQGQPVAPALTPDLPTPKRGRHLLPMLPDDELAALRTDLQSRITQVLRRSLHIRHLDAGSCNGCDWELTTLLNPVHDVQRLGIDFVASPRHADLLLVTGVMTRNLTLAALRTYQAMSEPRIVVAVGACGCSGGIFGTSYAGGGGIDTTLPVDVYIPGCPPRPQALIHGLLLAMGRLQR
jgi:Ni,Fe-hydrogenase III small subunit/Fe-S-cluster-containing hydrogenase component 2